MQKSAEEKLAVLNGHDVVEDAGSPATRRKTHAAGRQSPLHSRNEIKLTAVKGSWGIRDRGQRIQGGGFSPEEEIAGTKAQRRADACL